MAICRAASPCAAASSRPRQPSEQVQRLMVQRRGLLDEPLGQRLEQCDGRACSPRSRLNGQRVKEREARADVFDYRTLHNPRWRHSTIGNMFPVKFVRTAGGISSSGGQAGQSILFGGEVTNRRSSNLATGRRKTALTHRFCSVTHRRHGALTHAANMRSSSNGIAPRGTAPIPSVRLPVP